MLNEQSIEGSLKVVIEHIQHGNLEQAELNLGALNFERLQKPIEDPTKGPGRRGFIDPAGPFGPERVNATGESIRVCRNVLSGGDQKRALDASQKALKRWQVRDKV